MDLSFAVLACLSSFHILIFTEAINRVHVLLDPKVHSYLFILSRLDYYIQAITI